jgi:hypothetical protein
MLQFSPENQEGSSTGEVPDNSSGGESSGSVERGSDGSEHPHGKRRRRRIKIRKRIRIRKKPSAKKKIRKIAEITAWVAIVAGFIITLIVMVKELDIKDEKYKQMQKMKKQTQGKK